ncbi:MAG: RagB/SusD family nutrient uptake outer membrane protein [Bacteroidales bacterium]|jgi:hypothetical protein
MKRNNIYTLIAGISFILFASCDHYLDLAPHDELDYEAAFETAQDAEIAVRGVYYTMHQDYGYYDGQHLILPDVMSDNLILCSEGRLTFDLMQNWDIKPGNYYVGRAWAQPYKVINRANQVIARATDIEAEGDDLLLKNHVLGEAYAIRGMVYFDLVRYFGKNYADATAADLGVPYVTDPAPSLPERNTVAECYENIVSDLTMGESLMAQGAIDPDEGNTRFSSAAAKAMLARVYLTMEDWSNAISMATDVINEVPLSTLAEFPDVWLDASEAGVIFKVRITEQDNTVTNSGSAIGTYYSQTGPSGTRSEHVCSYELAQLFDTTDIRTFSYISQSEFNGKLFNHVWKYKERTGAVTPDLVDAKVLRTAEMYLIRAEALVSQASPDEVAALADLNALRAQRYEPFTAGSETGTGLYNAIQLERRLELAFEGQRWFDLKRLGLPVEREDYGDEADGGGLHYRALTLPAGSYLWQLPIPTTEIDANPNITQNDDY